MWQTYWLLPKEYTPFLPAPGIRCPALAHSPRLKAYPAPSCLSVIGLRVCVCMCPTYRPYSVQRNMRGDLLGSNNLPVLSPGKSHGRRSLVGYSPWGHWELDTTERLHFHFSLSCIGEGNGNPLQCSCLENPRDGEARWAASYGVA